MANIYDEVRGIIQQHRDLERAVDENAYGLGELLKNNLRRLRPSQLRQIKAQLRNFDMTTGTWKR